MWDLLVNTQSYVGFPLTFAKAIKLPEAEAAHKVLPAFSPLVQHWEETYPFPWLHMSTQHTFIYKITQVWFQVCNLNLNAKQGVINCVHQRTFKWHHC